MRYTYDRYEIHVIGSISSRFVSPRSLPYNWTTKTVSINRQLSFTGLLAKFLAFSRCWAKLARLLLFSRCIDRYSIFEVKHSGKQWSPVLTYLLGCWQMYLMFLALPVLLLKSVGDIFPTAFVLTMDLPSTVTWLPCLVSFANITLTAAIPESEKKVRALDLVYD